MKEDSSKENNNGKILNLYGPVVERSESGSVTYLRVNYSKDGKGGWTNPVVMITEEEISAREGDMISAVVSVDGVYEEQDRTGKSVSIPRLQILFVDRIEGDFFNVMGLPVCTLGLMLRQFGVELLLPPSREESEDILI